MKQNYKNLDPGMRFGNDNVEVVRQCLCFFVNSPVRINSNNVVQIYTLLICLNVKDVK